MKTNGLDRGGGPPAAAADLREGDVTPLSPSPLDALNAFYLEHLFCDEIDGGVDEGHDGHAYGWFVCLTCDARVAKRL